MVYAPQVWPAATAHTALLATSTVARIVIMATRSAGCVASKSPAPGHRQILLHWGEHAKVPSIYFGSPAHAIKACRMVTAPIVLKVALPAGRNVILCVRTAEFAAMVCRVATDVSKATETYFPCIGWWVVR